MVNPGPEEKRIIKTGHGFRNRGSISGEKKNPKENYKPKLAFLFFLVKMEISGKVNMLKQISFSLKEQFRISTILVFCPLWKAHWEVFSVPLRYLLYTHSVHSAALCHLSPVG